MDELSAALVTKALDGLAMRATAIAQNIANAGSPSYVPLRVTFEDSLRSAAQNGIKAVQQVTPQFTHASPKQGGAELRIDLELAAASQTALRYAALIDVLSRKLQISRLAVSGGQQ